MEERHDPQHHIHVGHQPGWAPQHQAWGGPPPRQAKTRRTTPLWATITAGVVGLIVGAGIGAGGKKGDSTPAAAAAPVVTTVIVTAPAPPGAPTATTAPASTAPVAVPAPSSSKPAAPPRTVATSRPASVPTTKAAPPPAPKPPTKPASQVVLSTSGDGIKDTASFTTGPEWVVKYTFDCSRFGMQGNFIVEVDGAGDVVANALAGSGADTSYQHNNPGTHYLSVNSECDWTLTVISG